MTLRLLSFLSLGYLLALAHGANAGEPQPGLSVSAKIDHTAFDQLLKQFVDERGLIDYRGWKEDQAARKALKDYLAQFAQVEGTAAEGDHRTAALVNAYNAFTIEWMLQNLPTNSIMETEQPFKGARWLVDGRKVSLDAIEHENLRPIMGWEVHSVVVCAALSCPPLQRRAATAENLDDMVATGYRTWLHRADLNSFHPERGEVRISKIFEWFMEDYLATDGGLAMVLSRFAPERYQSFLATGDFQVRFKEYDWSLNAQ